jgi:hypothetical protein
MQRARLAFPAMKTQIRSIERLIALRQQRLNPVDTRALFAIA